MPPTITEKDDAAPSAPPLSDSIPVVAAVAVNDDPPSATTPQLVAASMPPRPPPNLAVPKGMMAKTVTTKYADGREVTVTEFVPADSSNSATANQTHSANSPPATTSTPTNNVVPRRDLGSTPVTFTCPFCNHSGPTKAIATMGDCTWISVIILLLCCFPFFWIPFVCNNCKDTSHHCRNCGRVVGESRAECCK